MLGSECYTAVARHTVMVGSRANEVNGRSGSSDFMLELHRPGGLLAGTCGVAKPYDEQLAQVPHGGQIMILFRMKHSTTVRCWGSLCLIPVLSCVIEIVPKLLHSLPSSCSFKRVLLPANLSRSHHHDTVLQLLSPLL